MALWVGSFSFSLILCFFFFSAVVGVLVRLSVINYYW